jgi:hypothetical protein
MSVTVSRWILAALLVFLAGLATGKKLESIERLKIINKTEQDNFKRLQSAVVTANRAEIANREVINALQTDNQTLDNRWRAATERVRIATAKLAHMPNTSRPAAGIDGVVSGDRLRSALRRADETQLKLRLLQQWVSTQTGYNAGVTEKK